MYIYEQAYTYTCIVLVHVLYLYMYNNMSCTCVKVQVPDASMRFLQSVSQLSVSLLIRAVY